MTQPRILVAGIGNIFLGDDAFGVAVVRELVGREVPAGVRVVDFGIRALDLAYALMDGYERVILVDAVPRGEPPGTVYVIEPDVGTGTEAQLAETHGMDPVKVLRLVRSLGGTLPPLTLVGCEPATFGSDEEPALGLSEPVQAAVEEAVAMIEALIRRALAETQSCTLNGSLQS
jgi:hydrogenase maturation protease